jgi:hypothetical protein
MPPGGQDGQDGHPPAGHRAFIRKGIIIGATRSKHFDRVRSAFAILDHSGSRE